MDTSRRDKFLVLFIIMITLSILSITIAYKQRVYKSMCCCDKTSEQKTKCIKEYGDNYNPCTMNICKDVSNCNTCNV